MYAKSLLLAACLVAIWTERRNEIKALAASGEAFLQAKSRLIGRIEPDEWEKNVNASRKQFAHRGKSWFRWFNAGYREAVRTLEELCPEEPPRDLKHRLELLDELIAGQKAGKVVADDDAGDGLGKRAFGTNWNGLMSDWPKLKSIVKWVEGIDEKKLPSTCRHLLVSVHDLPHCGSLVQKIGADFKPVLSELTTLFKELKLDLATAFGGSELNNLSLVEIKARLDQWIAEADKLDTWIGYRIRWE